MTRLGTDETRRVSPSCSPINKPLVVVRACPVHGYLEPDQLTFFGRGQGGDGYPQIPDAKATTGRTQGIMRNGKTIKMAIRWAVMAGVAIGLSLAASGQTQKEYMAGYLIQPVEKNVDRSFNAGYSMYVPAWPLLRRYPGHRFQTGLPGTWMFAQYDDAPPKDMYSDVEGGLGWWTDTRFPTETPKFLMGGVGPNFSEIANGPGHGAGSWEQPRGVYGVAQLSPWLLFPPDGLNLKQGTCGQLFGYGYLGLPLAEAKSRTNGTKIATGNHCWTLFLNTSNFKGPVAFFTPYFWSHFGLTDSRLVGRLLDTRPVDPNREGQMETQYIPCQVYTDKKGESYARIAPTSFPLDADGKTILVHQDTAYNWHALWDEVSAWFAGGPASKGNVKPQESHVRTFGKGGYATWEIRLPKPDESESKWPLDWASFATPVAFDAQTFGYKWNFADVIRGQSLATLPEYYHLVSTDGFKSAKWAPTSSAMIPAASGLREVKWERPSEGREEPYETPTDPTSCWKTPGPKAGPFTAHLGDGTVVTYSWYRFADQPALLNADLTKAERERMQVRVEKLHRAWPKSHDYLAPPRRGTLASIDPALIVKPPKGMEVGYVPIATRQELEVK